MKTQIITNRFEVAALLRYMYSIDLDYENNLLDTQVLAIPFLKKLRSRLEKKIISSKAGKDIKISVTKYELVAVQAFFQNDLSDPFYSAIYGKLQQKYYSLMHMLRIE